MSDALTTNLMASYISGRLLGSYPKWPQVRILHSLPELSIKPDFLFYFKRKMPQGDAEMWFTHN